jgi:hypothetical protein
MEDNDRSEPEAQSHKVKEFDARQAERENRFKRRDAAVTSDDGDADHPGPLYSGAAQAANLIVHTSRDPAVASSAPRLQHLDGGSSDKLANKGLLGNLEVIVSSARNVL